MSYLNVALARAPSATAERARSTAAHSTGSSPESPARVVWAVVVEASSLASSLLGVDLACGIV